VFLKGTLRNWWTITYMSSCFCFRRVVLGFSSHAGFSPFFSPCFLTDILDKGFPLSCVGCSSTIPSLEERGVPDNARFLSLFNVFLFTLLSASMGAAGGAAFQDPHRFATSRFKVLLGLVPVRKRVLGGPIPTPPNVPNSHIVYIAYLDETLPFPGQFLRSLFVDCFFLFYCCLFCYFFF